MLARYLSLYGASLEQDVEDEYRVLRLIIVETVNIGICKVHQKCLIQARGYSSKSARYYLGSKPHKGKLR